MLHFHPGPNLLVALVLRGGNAPGASHAGAYQALQQLGWLPDRVVGTSAGAVNRPLMAGNAADRRLERLHELWRLAGPASDRERFEIREEACRGSAVGVVSPTL